MCKGLRCIGVHKEIEFKFRNFTLLTCHLVTTPLSFIIIDQKGLPAFTECYVCLRPDHSFTYSPLVLAESLTKIQARGVSTACNGHLALFISF